MSITTEPEKISWFTARDEDSYRDEAKNILDSYAHPWDFLTELAQNSVDAIAERAKTNSQHKGEIHIAISKPERSVTFTDNGVGIEKSILSKVLNPHFSGKRGKGLRGEKGVGLTYVALVGDEFEITTKHNGVVSNVSLRGSQSWLKGTGPRPDLMLKVSHVSDPYPKRESYTIVKLSKVFEQVVGDEELDVFALGDPQLIHLLRSKTAIGNTASTFEIKTSLVVSVKLTVDNGADGTQKHEVPFSFASPISYLSEKSVLTLQQVKKYREDVEDQKIYGKTFYFNQSVQNKTGKEIKAHCVLTSRHVYSQINEDQSFPDEIGIQGGIYVSTKGMPTGIILPTPRTGRAGYWPTIF